MKVSINKCKKTYTVRGLEASCLPEGNNVRLLVTEKTRKAAIEKFINWHRKNGILLKEKDLIIVTSKKQITEILKDTKNKLRSSFE